MDVVCHLGAHCCEGNRLKKTLIKNRSAQMKRGVLIPETRSYQRAINELLLEDSSSEGASFLGEQTLTCISSTNPSRLVLTSERFFGLLRYSLKHGRFYSNAEVKLQTLRQAFPNARISVFVVIRNPATFMPAILSRSKVNSLLDLTDGHDPRNYLWSELLGRVSLSFPEFQFTVCCFEDLPFLWGELVRGLLDEPFGNKIRGSFDLFEGVIQRSGASRFREFLKVNPGMSELQRRRVMAAFMEKYAIEEKLYQEVSLPGWSDDIFYTLTEIYEDDSRLLSKIPNVNFLSV